MTTLLQCLRDELVRRDYAATTIRSYIQTVYLHLSRRHLHAAPIPLEQLHVTPPPVVPRSRLLRKRPQS